MKTVSVILAALFSVGSARAAVLVQDTTTPIEPPVSTDWSSSLAFAQFDPAMGTLQSVELNLNGSFDGEVIVVSGSPGGGSGSAWTDVQMMIEDAADNLPAPAIDLDSSAPFSLSTYGGTGVTVSAVNTFDQTYTCASLLSEFTGTGSASLSASTQTNASINVTAGDVHYQQQSSMAMLTGSVTYTFTPVPEPATSALVAGALSILTIRARNQRMRDEKKRNRF